MSTDKKKVAAVAAVMAYLQTEEEAACAMAVQAASQARYATAMAHPTVHVQQSSQWAVSGRMEQMQMRSLMQMRGIRG